jgi:hypothetical protein
MSPATIEDLVAEDWVEAQQHKWLVPARLPSRFDVSPLMCRLGLSTRTEKRRRAGKTDTGMEPVDSRHEDKELQRHEPFCRLRASS